MTYGFGMRSEMRRLGATAAVVAAVLCLGACAPEDPGPKPSPDPTSTPLFASDEEALAAAEEAYGRYQTVEDEVFAAGGAGSERIEEVAVRDALEAARLGFEEAASQGFRGVGRTKFDSFELQQVAQNADVEDVVLAYVCLDFSESDILNQQNVSIVNPDRLIRQAFQVSFDYEVDTKVLVLAARDPWTGTDSCG